MSFNLQLSAGNNDASKVKTGASLGQNGDAVAEIVRAIKKEISIPLFVKLTPEGGKIAQVATALYAAGADAVGGTSNRMAIPPLDLEHPERAPYHLQDEISMSCHCGSWVKPLALRDTYEIRKVNGPEPKIMMAGGVRNWRDACEMFMCGADLVGICSETLISGYDFIGDLIDGVRDFMDSHGYNNTREMRDLILPHVRSAADVRSNRGWCSPHRVPRRSASADRRPRQVRELCIRKAAETSRRERVWSV
jgi:dihydroorotate dehydrogenase